MHRLRASKVYTCHMYLKSNTYSISNTYLFINYERNNGVLGNKHVCGFKDNKKFIVEVN